MYSSPSVCVVLSFLVGASLANLQLFPDGLVPENIVSNVCKAAIISTVTTCPSTYVLYPVREFGGPFENTTSQEAFCSAGCTSALAKYRTAVTSACAKDPQPWQGIPADFSGDRMAAYQKRMCLKDPSNGEYCIDYFANYTLPATISSITDLPRDYKCSACYLSFLQAMQATPYSNYDESWVADYQTIQATCGVKFPTNVQPWPLDVTQDLPTGFQYANATEEYCLSGKHVTVASGSNCQTIAEQNNVSAGTLRLINGLFPDCSNLIGGASLCLPMACLTYKVQNGDSCFSISDSLNGEISITDLISYNPSLNSQCSNLKADENICIFPAAGQYTATMIPNVNPTQTDVYATATVAPPGPTGIDTTPRCGRYYQARAGDECGQISVNNTITVDLFLAINPSLNRGCTNIFPDYYYCVMPMSNWNTTGSAGPSVTVAPPAPTQPGTTTSCYKWYTIQTGDYCDLVLSAYGLTFDQFRAWNTGLKSDCTNLALGDAYCVKGGSAATITAVPTSASRTSTKSSTLKTSSTSIKSSAAPTIISSNGACGLGVTCTGSSFGTCCSQYGYCGSTSDYCAGSNCQSGACT